jgi:DNA polymerase III epsilon subunit-like protein
MKQDRKRRMKFLIFDTETTGLLPKRITTLECIPHILQLSYIVYDSDTHVIESRSNYIRIPSDVVISQGSINVHGITRNKIDESGIEIQEALFYFSEHYKECDYIVAHNLDFDERMVNYECVRNNISPVIHKFDPRKTFYCTMKKGIDICKIEKESKNGRKYFKWPKLEELHSTLFNQSICNLHDAYHDNLVCLRCFVQIILEYDLVERNNEFKVEFEKILRT